MSELTRVELACEYLETSGSEVADAISAFISKMGPDSAAEALEEFMQMAQHALDIIDAGDES